MLFTFSLLRCLRVLLRLWFVQSSIHASKETLETPTSGSNSWSFSRLNRACLTVVIGGTRFGICALFRDKQKTPETNTERSDVFREMHSQDLPDKAVPLVSYPQPCSKASENNLTYNVNAICSSLTDSRNNHNHHGSISKVYYLKDISRKPVTNYRGLRYHAPWKSAVFQFSQR